MASIVDTMQNWGDNALLRVPGYRDRVAHVDLIEAEGGLNLDMPHCRVARMASRRQTRSRPALSTRFRRSYRGAMAENMRSTAARRCAALSS